ncbi:hypothetical protein CYLTODRAFT_437277 [Cylindrobasidium torrendii FP15055 ss-10]|uniref:DNA polymerase n=1 Tax=Cylindrobasidium torrendii FP15055 ss-10 TaxID=1314674 RepID=A0A0D7B9K6_9AGAR|nr:hypothetical protein CYLTODRAFT_437277 [Cylindrobasidium torrendii FP15055 ss-10]
MADRAKRQSALAELARLRKGGKRETKDEDEDDSRIYDEVTEEQYRKVVRGRLARDDFVVDDGVEGYTDNGMDDFGEAMDYDSEEEDTRAKRKKGKKKEEPKPKAKARVEPPAPRPAQNAYRPQKSAEDEASLMDDILGGLDDTPSVPATRPRKRKPSPDYTSYRSKVDYSSDGPIDDFGPGPSDFNFTPKKKPKTDAYVAPAAAKLESLDLAPPPSDNESASDADFTDLDLSTWDDDIEEDIFKDEKQNKHKVKFTINPTPPKTEPTVVPNWIKAYESLPEAEPEIGMGSTVTPDTIHITEPDGSLHFYWLDYLETGHKLLFTGKVKDKTSGQWISCCVSVENLERNVFALPRTNQVDHDENGNEYDTSTLVCDEDVRSDFEIVRKALGISKTKAKFVTRKYAFAETDVPREEHRWYKIIYPFSEPQITSNARTTSIQKFFGTNTSAFELLVLKRKIMGPCWIKIMDPKVEKTLQASWCKVEATVDDPKDFNPFSDNDPTAPQDMPPLTIVSLSVKTVVNHIKNRQETICVTARTWRNMNIEDSKPPEQIHSTVQTWIRPLHAEDGDDDEDPKAKSRSKPKFSAKQEELWPPRFAAAAAASTKSTVTITLNERQLLSTFMNALHNVDPDVIVGHEFLGSTLDVLLHRLKKLKFKYWSRLSRIRRTAWPTIGKQGSNGKFLVGRMLCDLSSDGAKGMITSNTWSLTEMVKTHLRQDRLDVDPDDVATYFDATVSGPDRLMDFVRLCELDAFFQMAIASNVQILGLTKQLTNLAGNSWNKTLNGGRAERNEYILLHEFHRLKYIVPDKSWGKKFGAEIAKDGEDSKPGKSKRDKYKGGLVFEPKRGLWDNFILVMDFNSLYPSIIQEYNIDFTTAATIDNDTPIDEENLPEPPKDSVPQGVLPRLISTLVNRRRQVKALMKDKKASQAQLLQWNIKQTALKLTANSMYGCLGFEYSRFYAKPLAALTTFKGREILTHTRELAESINLDVVYGDTDSVFVNSNVTELADAMKIANEFKKKVNECYRLLEIDLDGVFQRLLLLQKKKYAAIKMEGDGKTTVEVKGLDMKRREYSAVSKNASQYILDKVLSGNPTDVVVEEIHDYLTAIGTEIREGKVKLDDFIIFKRLGKNPEEYPAKEGLPHVNVAKRMLSERRSARAGDVIPYLICVPEDPTKTSVADRAYHPDDVRKAGSTLKIDYEYYIVNQILPPIERLCDPIDGTERARLAECLGLDPSRYRNSGPTFSEEQIFTPLDSKISDRERFKLADPLNIRCRSCATTHVFKPIYEREAALVQVTGVKCLNTECGQNIGSYSIQAQLETQIRDHIAKFYQGWLVCSDPSCEVRTRVPPILGIDCSKEGCGGFMCAEYTATALFDQLRYYALLFDGVKAESNAPSSAMDEVKVIAQTQSDFLADMKACVDKYLTESGYQWVSMNKVFAWMSL